MTFFEKLNATIGATSVLLLALFSTSTYSLPAEPIYSVDHTVPFALSDMTSTVQVSLSDDQTRGPFPIGFDFEFFGTVYDEFYISSNGFISFTNQPNGCCSGQDIPDANAPNNLVAGFWEDIDPPEGGLVSYNFIANGGAPNRELIVQFKDTFPFNGPPKIPSTFQIKLKEGSNDIELHCDECVSDSSNWTQGIENSTGTVAYSGTDIDRTSSNLNLYQDAIRFTLGVNDGSIVFAKEGTYASDLRIDGIDQVGDQVLQVSATDNKSGNNIVYSFLSGNEDGMFAIDANTGIITLADISNLTSKTVANLIVRAQEKLDIPNRFATAQVRIKLLDGYLISQETGSINLNGNSGIGQSFTTAEAGYLEKIAINVITPPLNGEADLWIWEEADNNPASSGISALNESKKHFNAKVNITSTGRVVLDLASKKIYLNADTNYAFELAGQNLNLTYASGNLLPQKGRLLYNNRLYGCCDLNFALQIAGKYIDYHAGLKPEFAFSRDWLLFTLESPTLPDLQRRYEEYVLEQMTEDSVANDDAVTSGTSKKTKESGNIGLLMMTLLSSLLLVRRRRH